MKRKGLLILACMLSFIMLSVSGCRKYEQIQVVSGTVESLNMRGFRSVDIVLSVEVSNPAGKVALEDVTGVLKHFGKVIGNVTLAPLELRPRTVGQYKVEARVELAGNVGLRDLMKLMDVRTLNELTIDVSAVGKVSGIKMKKAYKDIPLKKLLEDHNNEKV